MIDLLKRVAWARVAWVAATSVFLLWIVPGQESVWRMFAILFAAELYGTSTGGKPLIRPKRPEGMLTLMEAAERFGSSESYVAYLITTGHLLATTRRGVLFIHADEVDYVRRQTGTSLDPGAQR